MELIYAYSAYQNDDINEFEKILKTNRQTIMDDLFIREHIEGRRNVPSTVPFQMKFVTELLRNIRTQVLIKLIKPYTRIHLPFVSQVCSDVANVWCSTSTLFFRN